MEYNDSLLSTPETKPTVCVRRKYTANQILEDFSLEGDALKTMETIVNAGRGDRFVDALAETYTDGIDFDELYNILTSGDEAFELAGINPDGSPAEWDLDDEPDSDDQESLDENVEVLTSENFDRMTDGFPTVVYTINEDDPDWEEKFQDAQKLVYEVSRNLECYDVYLEGGFHSPDGWEEVQLVVDQIYDCDYEDETRDEERAVITDLIDRLVQRYGFRKFDFDNYEVDTAVRPDGTICTFDGDLEKLRNELAHTHEFEEPCEIGNYLRDNGFNVVDTDDGNGFEAWYVDPSNSKASYIKFKTNQCWDNTYGPVCRLNESTFKIVHPKNVVKG